jgi:tetratricopeptide (TPR) repeat protein
MYALGNAFYHLGNYEASKGEYLKFISLSEYDAEKIKFVEISRKDHVKLFGTLASVYNNLGAIYQKQNEEGKSSLSYWKAIDYAKRLKTENDFARVNLARSYKPGRKVEPIIDENIPFSIDYYRENMR